jgi:hypothetical protein
MRLTSLLFFIIIPLCAITQSSLGTLIVSETNNDGIICYGENFSFNLLGNNSMPTNLNIPAVNYNPGVGMAIFLAPPSYTNNEVVTDPSFVGIFQSQPYAILMNPFVFDFNSFIASIPPPFTGLNAPITLYFQAITLYDIAINLPYVSVPGNPIDAAQSNTIALTVQPEIIITTNQDCLNNWIEFSVEQAGMGNITFDINNAYPVVANFPNSISNQTTEIINNISGNNVPFGMLITNPDGCSTALNDNFIGTFTATLAPVGNLCESDNPIVLVASPAGGTWMGNPQVLNNETFTPSGVNINSNTIYTVVYTPPTPPGGCAVSASIDINVIPDANSQFTAPTAMCINENPVTLQTAVGGGVWSSPNNSVSNQGIFTPSLSGAGIQTIIYSIGGTCPSYTTHDVVVHDLPTIQFDASATEGCLPLTIDFSNTTAGTGSNFIWTIDGITEAIGVDAFSHTFENSLCSSIGLTLTDQNGCTHHLDSLNLICPYPDPVVDFEYNPIKPSLADYEISFNETLGNTAVNYWEFGDGQSSYDWSPTHFYDVLVPSEFEVCLTGFDVLGCESKICKFLQIESGFEIYCPTAFTPGNDGLNDGFKPVLVSKKEIFKYTMRIFNRNGEKIYESHDIHQAWYGNNDKGDLYVADGAYTWIIDITLEGLSEKQTFKGSVVIVR